MININGIDIVIRVNGYHEKCESGGWHIVFIIHGANTALEAEAISRWVKERIISETAEVEGYPGGKPKPN